VKKTDCLLWFTAFFGTLFLGVQIGLLVSIGVSLALVVIESVRPQMTVLWRLPGTPIWRSIKQESSGIFCPGVMVVRIGASMYFANVAFIRDYIHSMVGEFSEAADVADTRTRTPISPDGGEVEGVWVTPEPIRYIVVEMTPVISIDSTALHMLEDMHRDLKERGIRLAFSTMGNRVEDTLKRAGLIEKMGAQWIFPSVHRAVQHCLWHRTRQASPPDATPGSPSHSVVNDSDGVASDKEGAAVSAAGTVLAPPAVAKGRCDGAVEIASVQVEP